MNDCPKEVICGGVTYKYKLERIGDNVCELVATPCPMPTAVYNVATIRCRQNTCTGFEYYQAQVNIDPCTCIQDCNLDDLIERATCLYVNNLQNTTYNNNNYNNRCCNRNNGLFNR